MTPNLFLFFFFRYDLVYFVTLTKQELKHLGNSMSIHHFVTELKKRLSYSRICLKNSLRTRIKTISREMFEDIKRFENNTHI